MKYTLLFLFGFLFVLSCSSTKTFSKSAKKNSYDEKRSKSVLREAKTFLGTKYQLGGTDKKGMDCSGLVIASYQKVSVYLPRKSKEQATLGIPVFLNKVNIGDLLFFNTFGAEISHVGMVEQVTTGGEIFFIHSSTSKGVIISSMNEPYWNARFIFAKRILTQ